MLGVLIKKNKIAAMYQTGRQDKYLEENILLVMFFLKIPQFEILCDDLQIAVFLVLV